MSNVMEPITPPASGHNRILIVDDEAPVRRILRRILEQEGFTCREADCARSAMKLLEKEQFSLVLLDIQMPDQSGLQLLPIITERFHDLAVVMATVEDDRNVAEQALQDGAYGYVTKPFHRNDIIINVMGALERLRLSIISRENKTLLETLVRERTAEITRLAELQRLAIDISTRFISLVPDQWSNAVEEALADIGEFVGADRCHLLEFTKDGLSVNHTYEWCGPGVSPQTVSLRGTVLHEKLPWFSEKLKTAEVVRLSNLERLPEEAIKERDHFRAQDVRSLIVIPMVYQEQLAGCIGFDTVHQEIAWPEETVTLLHLVGGIFVNFLERQGLEREKTAIHAKLLQTEKLASLGQLAAGVAHEINTPIGFISSNLGSLKIYTQRLVDYLQSQSTALTALEDQKIIEQLQSERKNKKIDYIAADIQELIVESLDGAGKVKEIVKDLKNFARMDEHELIPSDINLCLENTLTLVRNEVKYKASVKKELSDLPDVPCYPQKLGQAFANLLVNAAQAIEDQGEITIKTLHKNDSVFVIIKDTGQGIEEEILSKIFDPFFTTKDVGQGTGLGLSITHDIIVTHGGDITVTSEIGRGTTFTIRLPLHPQKKE